MEWDKLHKQLPNLPKEPHFEEPKRFGLIILFVFVGGFLLWAFLFPLDSAAIADGYFIVEGERKTIQHLEGGIIKEILIEEGKEVKAGEVLIKLDDTQAKASLDLLQGQTWEALASEARILSELNNEEKIDFPEELLKAKINPKVKKIIAGQQKLFTANNNSYQGQTLVLKQRIEQFNKQIESYQAQEKSSDTQLKLIEEEITAVQYLADRKLIDKPRLLALKREAAKLLGDRDEYLGMIAKAHQGIGETQSQLYALAETKRKQLLEQLRLEQQKLADLQEKLKAASDVLSRTIIIAPQDGIILGLKKHTIGGVITPGQDICDIVPSSKYLILEVHISPSDIDIVTPGLPAKVRLTAYKQRVVPIVDGIVSQISADVFEEPNTKIHYYKARIQLSPKSLKTLQNVKLYPGMPAQAMIIVERRTAFDYLITPLLDNFRKAFREE